MTKGPYVNKELPQFSEYIQKGVESLNDFKEFVTFVASLVIDDVENILGEVTETQKKIQAAILALSVLDIGDKNTNVIDVDAQLEVQVSLGKFGWVYS